VVAPLSDGFVRVSERFAKVQDLDLVNFAKDQRKDDLKT
jgi:hypothetical protein